MAKKILKKIFSKAKKGVKSKKQPPKAPMIKPEPISATSKKKKNSTKILTAEGWKRAMEKERRPALKKS
jgi:hypothetical protein